RIASAVLFSVSALSLLAMLHHPTVSSESFEHALQEIERERGLNASVHGAMIVFTALYYWAFSVLTKAIDSPWAQWGQLAAALASALLIGAAIVSGFLFPEFAASLQARSIPEETARPLMRLLRSTNLTLAELGIAAYALAMCSWGAALMRHSRRLGALGLGLGLAIGAAVVFDVRWGVFATTLFAAALAAWSTAAGIWMWRSKPSVPDLDPQR
ncbi:MAG: hypothetical protein AAFX94_11940, partial [Myxococcota bacterium]